MSASYGSSSMSISMGRCVTKAVSWRFRRGPTPHFFAPSSESSPPEPALPAARQKPKRWLQLLPWAVAPLSFVMTMTD